MRIYKKITVAILVLFLFAMAVNQFSLKVAADNFQGVQVRYSKSVFSKFLVNKGDRFAVHFGSGTGTFTAVGMLPNGSPVFLGYYHGDGSFHVSMKAVLAYSKIWEEHLTRMGVDPESVNPGMLFLGVVRKGNTTYSTAFAVPIRVDKVLEGYEVKVSTSTLMLKLSPSSLKPLNESLTGKGTKMGNRSNGIESIWDDYPPTLTNPNHEKFIMNLVPRRLNQDCYNSEVCLYWAPDYEVLSYGINASIPLVIAHIWGQVDSRDSMNVRTLFNTKSSSGVSISFSTLGVENDGDRITPISAGPTFTLKDQGEWLQHVVQLYGKDLPNESEAYVMSGIVGHYVVMRFRLYAEGYDETGGRLVVPYDNRAFFTIAVPVFEKTLEGARIKSWDGIFSANNGSELVDKVKNIVDTFEEYRNYTSTGDFYVDVLQHWTGLHYTPLFSMGVSVDNLGMIPVAGFSIGMSSNDTSVLDMYFSYNSWYDDQKSYVTTYKLKGMYLYLKDHKSYIIPVMYVDIYRVPKHGPALPINSHHPVYPLDRSAGEG